MLYVEARCVDHGGRLDHENMRTNFTTHPLLRNDAYGRKGPWKPSYGTRLDNGKTLPDHDDWDCLDELDDLGLVVIVSLVNGFVQMTDKGREMVSELRRKREQ